MDSYCNRTQTIFTQAASLFGIAAVLCHLSSFVLFNLQPQASVTFSSMQDFTLNSYLNADQANIFFDLDLDLRSEFHWAQNHLFVYVVARYETESSKFNDVVVWDEVVGPSVDNGDDPEVYARVSRKKMKNKYPLTDQFRQLKGKEIELVVRYQRLPIIGLMQQREFESSGEGSRFTMPDKYFRAQHKVEGDAIDEILE